MTDQGMSDSLSEGENWIVFLIFHCELTMAQGSHVYQNCWKNKENLLVCVIFGAFCRNRSKSAKNSTFWGLIKDFIWKEVKMTNDKSLVFPIYHKIIGL